MRRAAKTDANQAEIVAALRKVGATVTRPDTRGANNPNFKNAGWHTCVACSAVFHSYNKARKYCSSDCYRSVNNARLAEMAHSAGKCPKPRKEEKQGYRLKCVVCALEFRGFSQTKYCRDHKDAAKVAQANGRGKPANQELKKISKCQQCCREFEHYKSKPRKFCSYSCHVDNGGALRAGAAAKRMSMKYGVKKDANHKEVVEALRAAGVSVIDMAHVGSGFPDLICGANGLTVLVEIKNKKTAYGRRGLNKLQQAWKNAWTGGPYAIVDSPEAALRAMGVVTSVGEALAFIGATA